MESKKNVYLKTPFVLTINIWFLFLAIATIYIGSVVDHVVFASSDYEWHENPLRRLLVFLMQYSPWIFLILSAVMIGEGYLMSKKYSQRQYETNALKWFAILSVVAVLAVVLFIPWALLSLYLFGGPLTD